MSEVVTTSTTDMIPPTLTKEELRRQKCAIYQKEYMREYYKKGYNTDEEYRQYGIDVTKKSSCEMSQRYVKAYQYIKNNNIYKTFSWPLGILSSRRLITPVWGRWGRCVG
jgi:hypothetical protein